MKLDKETLNWVLENLPKEDVFSDEYNHCLSEIKSLIEKSIKEI